MVGRVIADRYRILDVLGTGGVGVVYRAEQLGTERLVAMKLLHPDHASNDALRQRFEREATALAEVAHANIVPVIDYGISVETPFIVMELLHGQTLEALLEEERLIAPARAVAIIAQTLEGLAFAHARGLIHRDLKPANIFLEEVAGGDPRVRILDFGLAKFVAGSRSSAQPLTKAGSVFGTPTYMAPEQAVAGEMDARTDVYSVGAILFELLAGAPPYSGLPHEIARAHLTAPIPTLREKRSDIAATPALARLLSKAMAKEQRDRYRDASEMLAAVRALPDPPVVPAAGAATEEEVWARAAHGAGDDQPRKARGNVGLVVALVVAVLIAGAVALVALGGSP
jgi:serine/threonine-protein kinase